MSVEPILGLFNMSLKVENELFAVPFAAESSPIISLLSVGARKTGLFCIEFEALMQFSNRELLLNSYSGKAVY
jgi:hypothetical protein